MKIAFEANYHPHGHDLPEDVKKALGPCVGCKNRLDLPCDGCAHYENKKYILCKGKHLIKSTIDHLQSPTKVKHDIIEAIIAEQHKIEEELDSLYMDHPEWGNKAAIVEGLKMAIEIARKV